MRSTDHVGRSGGPHGTSRETISARPNDSADSAADKATHSAIHSGRKPGCPVLGPFGFLDHHAMGLFYGEYAYFYRVPMEFDETATAEIIGVHSGTASSFGPFEVPRDPKSDESDELGYGEFIGQEFGLPAGTYVGFIYRPDDLDAARETPTTDSFTVRLDDGSGMVVTSSLHPINVPALDFPSGVTWGPQSGPSRPGGSLEVTRLDAFTGSTFLPTGEVVFVVNAAAWGDEHTFAFTQPTHGTVVAIRPEHGRPGHACGDVIHLVYTPDTRYRTDPSVHTDGFTIAVDDGCGDITTASVPVVIVKSATVTATSGLPYTGTGSFSGRVEAPFDDVEGYVLAPAALLSESIDSLATDCASTNLTAYGSVTVDDDGSFTYTRDPGWAVVPVGEIDDSFAIIAYTAHNQWAVAVVPVGGATMPSPSIAEIVNGAPNSLQDA
jgi:hypothetical protein